MLSGSILHFQIIYVGKTNACHPHDITFPPGFYVTQNPSHWCNDKETLRVIQQVINPYVIIKKIACDSDSISDMGHVQR